MNGNFLKEYYEWSILEDTETIKDLKDENKVFQRIREKYQADPEIVMGCRQALHDNARQITFLRRRIEDETASKKRLG